MYEYDVEGDGAGSARRIAGVIAVLIAAAVGWFVVRPAVSDEESAPSIPLADAAVDTETTTSIDDVARFATSTAGAGTTAPDGTTTTEEASAAPTTAGASDAETETTPTGAPSTPQDVAPTTEEPATTTQEVAPTTEAPATTAGPRRTDPPAREVTYATLPNGLPEPVIVVFAGPEIRMRGTLWSRNASERLAGLALANSQTPAEVDNRIKINPSVPRSVGVRVIELNSARFPPGSAEVLMPHAAQLNRVVTIMNALPHITVDVIGHADQRGSEVGNQQLSAARATAVVNYVVSQGIDPDRLTARGVGETDLLTLNDDEAALALNRRTEFVFYGLLQ